jgi:hypothetical protein
MKENISTGILKAKGNAHMVRSINRNNSFDILIVDYRLLILFFYDQALKKKSLVNFVYGGDVFVEQ